MPQARLSILTTLAAGVLAQGAGAQVAPLIESTTPLSIASGPVWNQDTSLDVPRVVYSEDVVIPNAAVSRLVFGEVILSGSVGAGTGAFITITSATDGAMQKLNAEHMHQWAGRSAYFNGPLLKVQLWAYPGTGENRLSVSGALIESAGPVLRSICDSVDDRLPSFDNRQGRFAGGCTAWVINDMNSSLLSAGHCTITASSVMSFNVPLSTTAGALQASHPDDQYVVDATSSQRTSGGVGNDWHYIGVFPNSNHGQVPIQRYGVRHALAPAAPAVAGQTIRITGYGTNAAPMPRERNQIQQTHTGPYFSQTGTTVRYRTDTTGGNSGSCVLDESTGLAIGIHTHAGCSASGGSNSGTAIHHPNLQNALANPTGVCASGRGVIAGDLFAIGDRANNFGTLNIAPQNFAKITQIGAEWQGLAWNRTLGVFYAVNEQRQLYTVTRAGELTLLGAVSGPTNIITGLAFDPAGPSGGTLYAMQPSNGRLYRIDLATLVATPIGSAQGGTVRAIDFDSSRNVIWGIEQGGGARLVRIDPATGLRTLVGASGAGIVAAGDLAYSPVDDSLRIINSANGQLLSINPDTGVASVLGPTGGSFGAAFGMAWADQPPCTADFNNDQSVTIDDLFAFLNAWFANVPDADVDGVGGVAIDDLFYYLNAYFAGCE